MQLGEGLSESPCAALAGEERSREESCAFIEHQREADNVDGDNSSPLSSAKKLDASKSI